MPSTRWSKRKRKCVAFMWSFQTRFPHARLSPAPWCCHAMVQRPHLLSSFHPYLHTFLTPHLAELQHLGVALPQPLDRQLRLLELLGSFHQRVL